MRKVTVLEAEEAIGYHSSGRSATMLHYALGDPLVRALTLASRHFFEAAASRIQRRRRSATACRCSSTRARTSWRRSTLLDAEIAPFAELERVDEAGILDLCPAIRTGQSGAVAGLVDRNGIRLDPHALLQGHVRALRRDGGEIVTGARVAVVAAHRRALAGRDG